MSEGFLTDLRTAELFYRTCARFKIVGTKARVAVMREIVKRKKAKYLRDVQEYTRGRRIVRVAPKGAVNG